MTNYEEFWSQRPELTLEIAKITAEFERAKEKHERDLREAYRKAVAHDVETCPLTNGTGRCRGRFVCAQFTLVGPCEAFEREYRGQNDVRFARKGTDHAPHAL